MTSPIYKTKAPITQVVWWTHRMYSNCLSIYSLAAMEGYMV